MAADELLDAQIYVGTYKKYNEGSLFGKWIKLCDYTDREEFYEACNQLHSDEKDAELMFQDWEYIPDDMINESWISENVFELINRASEIANFESFVSFLDFSSYSLENEELDYLLTKFRDSYQGKYDTEEDFAYQLVEDCYNLSEFVKSYFDYEKYSDDLFLTDYYFDDNTKGVFCRNY